MKIFKKILLILIIIILLGFCLFVGAGYLNYAKAIKKTSITEKVAAIQGKENYVRYENINEDLLKATVSIEDRRFYEHDGVDYVSLIRAFVDNMFAKNIVGGGSTITQQLAKNMYFTLQPSYIRKVSEVFMAYDIEKVLDKKQIIELYVNIINYGDNYMGIKEASFGYFKKDPHALTLDEATLLAGLPQSPSNFQLSNHKPQALLRQRAVLEAMVRDKHIIQSQMDEIVSK